MAKSSTGLDENTGGFLCYVLTFITAIVFIIIEKDNKTIKFHAWQSLFAFGGLFVIMMIPIIGWLLAFILAPIALILWIVMMIATATGKKIVLPIAGKYALKMANK